VECPMHPLPHRRRPAGEKSSCSVSCTAEISIERSEPPEYDVPIGVAAIAQSADTANGDVEGCADLAHPLIAETSQPLRECSEGDALYRVEIHR